MRHFLKLIGLTASAAVGVAVGLSVLAGPEAAAARDRPVVEWGGATHTTQKSLEVWLRDRGLSYVAWAYQHPIAALRLEQEAERAQRAIVAAPSKSSSPARTPARPVGALLLVFVGAFGLALATLAGVLSASSVRFRPSLRFASDRRAYVALIGAACVAVAVASYAAQI
jgi:hypothetical protein